MSSQRLQKVLAQAGVASRRAAERLITEGRVRVNGRIVTELGARANPHKDRVEVDGRRLVAERLVYFLLHKPRGVVTTLDDPEGRKTIKDLLGDVDQRVFPVGRLDFHTSGALLLTNDGELAQALLHPTRAVPKTYNAKLQGSVEAPRLELLRSGVTLDDGQKTAPAEVKILRTDAKATSLEITISEGKNRQIHRMGEAIGRTVVRLTRIAFAGLTLDSLRPGHMRPLNALEVGDLKQKYMRSAPKRRKPLDPVYGAVDLPSDDDSDVEEAIPAPAWAKPARQAAAPASPRGGARRSPARGQRSPRADADKATRTGSKARTDRRTGAARTDRTFGSTRSTRGTRAETTPSKRKRPTKTTQPLHRSKRKSTR